MDGKGLAKQNQMEPDANVTTIEWNGINDNYNGWRVHRWWHWRAIHVHELCNDGVQKKRNNFFSYTSCFFLNSLILVLFLKLLQRLLITWLQALKHTGMHSPNANFKTHIQGKQVYVGLHHMVQILYYNQTLCVCVYVLPIPKASSKTSFETVHSFLPSKFQNS
jgi:hypothetical protein